MKEVYFAAMSLSKEVSFRSTDLDRKMLCKDMKTAYIHEETSVFHSSKIFSISSLITIETTELFFFSLT